MVLTFFLTTYIAYEANRNLASVLLREARVVAMHLQAKEGSSLLGIRWTPKPESLLPLLGETWEVVEVKGNGLRAMVAVPSRGGAFEVERRAPLFVPSWWPSLLMALALGFWAFLRIHGEIYRALNQNLGAARERIQTLNAALSNLDEGILVVELDGVDRVQFFNPRALELLNLPQEALPPLPLQRVWPALREALRSRVGETVLALPSHRLARVRILGSGDQRVVVIQDQAEVLRLAESLTQSRRTLDLLRAQAHEFRNTLHVLGGLLEMGQVEEALKMIQGELDVENWVEELLSHVQLPLLAALLLGKIRRAREVGVELGIEGILPARYAPIADVLVSVVGHLLENGLEAASGRPGGKVVVRFWEDSGLWLQVRDNGWGVPAVIEKDLFSPGVSGRGVDRGYGLALTRYQVEACGGRIGYYRDEGWTVFYAHFPREP